MISLDGRTAFVTGGASGIGRGIVEALASCGAGTIVADIDEEAARGVAGALPDSTFAVLDVTSDDSVAEVASRIGDVHVLVNCAGGSVPQPFLETDSAQWVRLVDLNLLGAMRCARAFAGQMVERHDGRIINISSNAGLQGQAGQAAYSAAKGGLLAFTRTLARELAPSGVTVNAVCPGITETPPLRAFAAMAGGREFIDRTLADVPLGRLGQPADVAGAVAYLAWSGAGYVTGQVLSVCGGMVMR